MTMKASQQWQGIGLQTSCVHPEVITHAINAGRTVCCTPRESWQGGHQRHNIVCAQEGGFLCFNRRSNTRTHVLVSVCFKVFMGIEPSQIPMCFPQLLYQSSFSTVYRE